MKYLITDSTETAQMHIDVIEKYLGDKLKPGFFYTTPIEITNEEHDDHGKWIVKIIDTGHLKCDELFNSQSIVDFDSMWFPALELQSEDDKSEDNESE